MNAFTKLVEKFQSLKNNDVNSFTNSIPGLMGVADATFANSGVDRNVKAPIAERDVSGRPIYNQNQFIEANRDFRSGIKGTVGRGALQGAMSGLQAGAALGGNPIIAGIGAGAGLIGGLLGGRARKKAMLKEATRREDLSTQAVNKFNTESLNYMDEVQSDDFRDAILRRRSIY